MLHAQQNIIKPKQRTAYTIRLNTGYALFENLFSWNWNYGTNIKITIKKKGSEHSMLVAITKQKKRKKKEEEKVPFLANSSPSSRQTIKSNDLNIAQKKYISFRSKVWFIHDNIPRNKKKYDRRSTSHNFYTQKNKKKKREKKPSSSGHNGINAANIMIVIIIIIINNTHFYAFKLLPNSQRIPSLTYIIHTLMLNPILIILFFFCAFV